MRTASVTTATYMTLTNNQPEINNTGMIKIIVKDSPFLFLRLKVDVALENQHVL